MKNKSHNNQVNSHEKNLIRDKNTEDKLTDNIVNNGINLDYDYNTEYGDGDIPDIDK